LRLKEFLNPHNLCFIVQEDDLDSIGYQFSDILSTKSAKILTCAKYIVILSLFLFSYQILIGIKFGNRKY